MTDAPALVYLEADDEITTAIRRVRASDAARVIVVAPGRSRATSSVTALRLLARTAEGANREIAVVGDPLTRSLAADAGLAAYGSVDDARRATVVEASPPGPRHAAIRVVRGPAADETAPTMVAVAPAADVSVAEGLDETRATPVMREPPAAAAAASRLGRRSIGFAAVLAVAAALIVAGVVAGARLLPAGTITVAPASRPLTVAYEIVVAQPDRRRGTVEATASVVATGEYQILERAIGVVTFRNYNVGAVEVPAGTLVAAGEQAFETTEAVTVPSGSLTSDGRISPGEGDALVVASAPGPGANVEANAIDRILSQGTAARLRGFPQNTSRLVLNAEPTDGGVDLRGPEITEADVEAAADALRSELQRLAGEALPDEPDLTVVQTNLGDATLEVPDGLAGTRDEAEAEIRGSRSWEIVFVDPDEIEAEAVSRLAADSAVPDGHDLIENAIAVRLGEPRLDGDRVVVEATVSGRAAPRPDPADIVERSRGLSVEEARLVLADLGEVEIELWPGWVDRVPELDWRIEVRIEEVRR